MKASQAAQRDEEGQEDAERDSGPGNPAST